jgi:hypothetical protein
MKITSIDSQIVSRMELDDFRTRVRGDVREWSRAFPNATALNLSDRRDLTQEMFSTWYHQIKKLNLSDISFQRQPDLLGRILRSVPNLEKLIRHSNDAEPQINGEMLELLPRLNGISFRWKNKTNPLFLYSLTNLTVIDLNEVWVPSIDLVNHIRLKKLVCKKSETVIADTSVDRLRYDLKRVELESVTIQESLLLRFQNLVHLELSTIKFNSLTLSFPLLRVIKLTQVTTFPNMFRDLPGLVELEMDTCRIFPSMFSNVTTLKKLVLEKYTGTIQDETLTPLSRVETLKMVGYCPEPVFEVTDYGLLQMPLLRTCEISYQGQITGEHLHLFQHLEEFTLTCDDEGASDRILDNILQNNHRNVRVTVEYDLFSVIPC